MWATGSLRASADAPDTDRHGADAAGPAGWPRQSGAARGAACCRSAQGAALTLDKQLPVASGIGGGSADAAATLRALASLWGLPLPAAPAVLALGADVPVCLAGRALRMTGVGEGLHPLAHRLPAAALVLVNPGVALSTPAVFAALERRDTRPCRAILPRLRDVAELAAFLA